MSTSTACFMFISNNINENMLKHGLLWSVNENLSFQHELMNISSFDTILTTFFFTFVSL